MVSVEDLARIPLFANLGADHLGLIVPSIKEQPYTKGRIIVHQDERGTVFFIMEKGLAKVTMAGRDGREITLSYVKPGEFFGEMSLLDGKPRSATVVAVEDSIVLVLTREDFLNQIRLNPEIGIRMLEVFSERIRYADEKIGLLTLTDVQSKLVHYFIHLAGRMGVPTVNGTLIENRPTHDVMAAELGTTRETITRIIGDLRRNGYIKITRKTLLVSNRLFIKK
ncbi:MAG: Crp/Fnr family transcriptional regulator [Nitrospirae bacterium]|nr:Crp/Fnr family transcriptional regulator [Nitrospirota bacterium]